jgi:hypothetical protein
MSGRRALTRKRASRTWRVAGDKVSGCYPVPSIEEGARCGSASTSNVELAPILLTRPPPSPAPRKNIFGPTLNFFGAATIPLSGETARSTVERPAASAQRAAMVR